jgi:signal transduction histidine kinase
MSRLGELVGHLIHEMTGGHLLLMLAFVAAVRREQIAHHRIDALQRQLARLDDAAHAGDRSKDAFLATLSHELRTPLNATSCCVATSTIRRSATTRSRSSSATPARRYRSSPICWMCRGW